MKSIIEEGKSVAHAITNAWLRAEKPSEFSVKIFQVEEKNFFGFISKPAKIALLFTATAGTKSPRDQRERGSRSEGRRRDASPKINKVGPKKQSHTTASKNNNEPTLSRPPRETTKSTDNEELKKIGSYCNQWVRNALSLMGLPNIETDVRYSGEKNVQIVLSGPVIGEQAKEQMLLRSLAHLATEYARLEGQKLEKSIYPYISIISQ